MNARHGLTALCAIVILAGVGASLAQEDNVLQRYDLAMENLQFAIDSVPGDGVQARDELERAVNALLTLSREATSVNLVQAMEQTFERARTAVENQSATDLAVQAAVLRGGFRRLVMDSSFTAATAGQLDVARSRLIHLAGDMQIGQTGLDELTNAADDNTLRLAFEAAVADAVAAEITVANRLIESDRGAAYVSLASAYGDSLMIQDSPRADVGLNATLLSTAQALVTGQDEAVAESSQTAQAQLSRLAAGARAGEAGTPRETAASDAQADAAASTEATTEPSPEATPAVAEPDANEAAAVPDQSQEQPAATQEAAAGQEPAAAASDAQAPGLTLSGLPGIATQSTPEDGVGVDPEVLAAVVNDQVLALAAATLQQREREEAAAELSAQLRAGGLSQTQATSLADGLLDAGFGSVEDAVDALRAASSRALAAFRDGDNRAARSALTDVGDAYAGPLENLLSARDSLVAADTSALLTSLRERPALRGHDLGLLASQVEAIDHAIAGEPQAGGHAIELMLDSYWSGWTRLAVLVILGILAFVPLRYLNLAFGGGNANWRLVAWALFLLLVPLVYEALAALGSILAELLNQPSLDVLAAWSMFTSTTGQVVWAVLLFIALLLATIGLRGICRQFGLLGGDSSGVGLGSASANPTLVDMTRSTKPSAVDWEDEF